MNVNFLNIFHGIENFLKNACTGHTCDGSDSIFCNFCGETECESDCFFLTLKNMLENLDELDYSDFKNVILLISNGMIISTVCHHIHLDFCAYCGEEEHEDDCLYEIVKHAICLKNETYRKDVEVFLNSKTAESLFHVALSEYKSSI